MVIEDFESLDAWRVWPDAWGGKAELAEAEAPAVGNAAVRITAPGIIYRELAALDGRVAREPQRYKGLAFHVRGDGSGLYGALAIGPAGEGSWQHGFVSPRLTACVAYFPLKDTNWHRVVIPWEQFLAEGQHPGIAREGGFSPADIRVIRIGHRWKYWRNYHAFPRHHYEIDHIELVESLPETPEPERDDDAPLALRALGDVLAKLRAGEQVRILCVGDSITAGAGTTAGQRYWDLLQPRLRQHFGNEQIVVEGWGIGGATLLDMLPWMRWQMHIDPPDLVTLMFGTNDSNAYPPEFFGRCLEQYLDRTPAITDGRTAVVPFTTIPGLKDWYGKTDAYAQVVRQVAQRRELAYVDLNREFKARGEQAIEPRFADGAHLNAPAHEAAAPTGVQLLTERAGTGQ